MYVYRYIHTYKQTNKQTNMHTYIHVHMYIYILLASAQPNTYLYIKLIARIHPQGFEREV